jgi:A/G-specific adenine glycosylase
MSPSSIRNRKLIIQKHLLMWYKKNARPLPWRKTKNPYRILLSEIMLQQTQVSRVMLKYPEFVRQFPNFACLAQARTADVIRAWSGMGYNNRALRLQQISRCVINDYGGRLPQDVETLQQLPGIGRYTANAVACFAFGLQTAAVDINEERVLSRLFPQRAQASDIWKLAEQMLPKGKAYDWNQALMELGGIICTATNPQCFECPLKQDCPSAFSTLKKKKPLKRKSQTTIPNRIYRGRIIATLRMIARHRSIEANLLAKTVKPDYSFRQKEWLDKLLDGLLRDGLIQIRSYNKKIYLSLPR